MPEIDAPRVGTASVIRRGGETRAIADIQARGRRLAGGFDALGARDGAAVATLLRNDFVHFETVFAARLTGAYFVPINWHFSAEEVAYIVADSGARVLVAHTDLYLSVRARLPTGLVVLLVDSPADIASAYRLEPAAARDVVASGAPGVHDYESWLEQCEPLAVPAEPPGSTMLYSSGTTGRPKGVRRRRVSDAALGDFYQEVAKGFGLTPGSRGVMTGPLYHSAPFAWANIALRLGTDLLLMPRFDAEDMLALIERERLTHMHMVPTMFVRMLKLPEAVRARYDLSSLQCMTHGAAPCPVEVKRRMIEWLGPVLHEYYGSTEGSIVTYISSEDWLRRPGSVGRAAPGVRIAVYDDDGRTRPRGTIGELYAVQVGAPSFDYHNRADERAAVERDGLITVGDVGYLDEEGYVFLCDRKRDMIISGGVNIYPAEIEAALLEHPGVRDCAVFGLPDEEFGESVAAVVERMDGATVDAAALREYLREHIARFKVPRRITFEPALPRLDNGKIYKARLRESALASPSAPR